MGVAEKGLAGKIKELLLTGPMGGVYFLLKIVLGLGRKLGSSLDWGILFHRCGLYVSIISNRMDWRMGGTSSWLLAAGCIAKMV